MIYQCNFITNIHDVRQAPASKPICRHAVTQLRQLPPETVKTDSRTVQTVNAALNFWSHPC